MRRQQTFSQGRRNARVVGICKGKNKKMGFKYTLGMFSKVVVVVVVEEEEEEEKVVVVGFLLKFMLLDLFVDVDSSCC